MITLGMKTEAALKWRRMIGYKKFNQLSFLKLFPRTESYDLDRYGVNSIVGKAYAEGYGFTSFFYIFGTEQLGAINLDFLNDCPRESGNELLKALGLPFHPEATLTEIVRILNKPAYEVKTPDGCRFCWFTLGTDDKSYVSCTFAPDERLNAVLVARKDLTDRVKAPFSDLSLLAGSLWNPYVSGL